MKVPIDALELFARVNGAFPRLAEYLKDQRAVVERTLLSAEKNTAIFRSQGDLQRLDRLIELLETSSEHVRKLTRGGP